jgi:hypothetical protein
VRPWGTNESAAEHAARLDAWVEDLERRAESCARYADASSDPGYFHGLAQAYRDRVPEIQARRARVEPHLRGEQPT